MAAVVEVNANAQEKAAAEPLAGKATSAVAGTEAAAGLGDELSAWVAEELGNIIKTCDLSTMTLGKVRTALEQNLGVEAGILDSQKTMIEELVRKQLQDAQQGRRRRNGEKDGEVREPMEQKGGRGEKRRRSPKQTPEKGSRQHATSRSRRNFTPGPGDLPAEALAMTIAGRPVELSARELVSGRKGFFACQSIPVESNGMRFEVQYLVQCAVVRTDQTCIDLSGKYKSPEGAIWTFSQTGASGEARGPFSEAAAEYTVSGSTITISIGETEVSGTVSEEKGAKTIVWSDGDVLTSVEGTAAEKCAVAGVEAAANTLEVTKLQQADLVGDCDSGEEDRPGEVNAKWLAQFNAKFDVKAAKPPNCPAPQVGSALPQTTIADDLD